jgi:hypothetical protein
MRKKMLFLVLAFAASAVSLSTTARAVPASVACQCTVYSDGSKCCPCRCNAQGAILFCTDVFCPESGVS